MKALGKLALAAFMIGVGLPAAAQSEQDLLELRNTVVNLIEALVAQGVMSREAAEAMIAEAQRDAREEVAARVADTPELRDDDVRVTYVPDIVKDQIRQEVSAEIRDDVVAEVKDEAQAEGWGVPAALPEWIRRIEMTGDVRVRAQGDFFSPDNAVNAYLDFNEVNLAGGIDRAGQEALLNTTEDRSRIGGRVRLGLRSDLGAGLSFGLRLVSGNIDDPITTNRTAGDYSRRWDIGVDQAFLRWQFGDESSGIRLAHGVTAGRFSNPFGPADELVWDRDLALEGVVYDVSLPIFRWSDLYSGRGLYATLGYFPVKEIDFSTDDAWLAGGKLGTEIPLGGNGRFGLSGAYYLYENISGVRNAPDSTLTDFTAPRFVQRGNTLFDIRNDLDPTTELFALAADYELLNASAYFAYDFPAGRRLSLTADYVRNIGYEEEDVFARTGLEIDERTEGYSLFMRLGAPSLATAGATGDIFAGDWSINAGYRYLQRDAVIDAFTASDFAQGGTDTEGFVLDLAYALRDSSLFRIRWFSSTEIDGPPLSIDILQMEFQASF